MDGKLQNVGRAYLVKNLQECGLSRRQSVKILKVVFGEMSRALARGKAVEFPFGKLVRMERSFGPYWEWMRDTPAHLGIYTVEHEMDKAGYLPLNGPDEPEPARRRGRKSGK